MKKYGLVLLVLVMIVAWMLLGKSEKNNNIEISSNEKDIPVKISEIKKEYFKNTIYTSGKFTTEDETYLSFKTGGIINNIYVKEGDAVRKGQLLASLDMLEINAQVSQAKEGYEKALRDYDRVNNLYKDSVASLSKLQDAKTGLEVATQQLNIAKFNLNYSEIRAIKDGYILKKFSNPGQMIASGNPVFLTNGAAIGNWVLKVAVSDFDWALISPNDNAMIECDAAKGEKIDAYVVKKSESIDPFTGTFTINLKVKPSQNIKIADGMIGKAQIFIANKKEVWSIPYESLIDGDAKSAFVFVTNDSKTAKKIKVKISDFKDNLVTISSGLENAKYLITSGSAYIKDQSTIRVIN